MLQHGVLVAVNAKKDVYVHTTNNQSSSSFSFYSARVYLLLSKQHKQMIEAREQFNLWILEWAAEMWNFTFGDPFPYPPYILMHSFVGSLLLAGHSFFSCWHQAQKIITIQLRWTLQRQQLFYRSSANDIKCSLFCSSLGPSWAVY